MFPSSTYGWQLKDWEGKYDIKDVAGALRLLKKAESEEEPPEEVVFRVHGVITTNCLPPFTKRTP